jgi:hypothetical protein
MAMALTSDAGSAKRIGMRIRSVLAALFLVAASALPALGVVGGREAAPDIARHVVMLSTQQSFCSAVVLGPRLLLTAAHCVDQAGEVRVLFFTKAREPILTPIGTIALHPKFNPQAYRKRQFTIDVALVTLPEPLPPAFEPLPLPAAGEDGVMSARYRIAGYGLAARGDGRTGGVLREAILRGVPPASDVQLRLEHAAGALVGACQGDSGGPVIRVSDAAGAASEPVLVGLLASARGAEDTRGCGGRTGVALLGPALDWIRQKAADLGSPLDR